MNILFVCTGNKFRSPAAEWFLSKHFRYKNYEAKSAGLSQKSKFGNKISKTLKDGLENAVDYCIDFDAFRSQPVTSSLVKWADKIFYMQPSHKKALIERFNTPERKLVFLGDLYPWHLTKIPDPAFSGKAGLKESIRIIMKCVRAL